MAGNIVPSPSSSRHHSAASYTSSSSTSSRASGVARKRRRRPSAGRKPPQNVSHPSPSPSPLSRGSSYMEQDSSESDSSRSRSKSRSASFSDLDECDWTYQLLVVQHPTKAAEYGAAVLSRLPLAPPLVAQLFVRDRDGNLFAPYNELPFLIAHLSLLDAESLRPVDFVEQATTNGHVNTNAEGTFAWSQRMLYGTLASSPHQMTDEFGKAGVFFIFPDVSIRARGNFILAVNLLRISRLGGTNLIAAGGTTKPLTSTRTNPFQVVTVSEYVAPPPTPLTQTFHRQGARMFTSFATGAHDK